jgi:MFS transporter, putative metabolite:H+ symporter
MTIAIAPTPISTTYQQLDDLTLSPFHWKVLLVSGLGSMFDAMDVLIVGSVVAAVAREWQLDATASQWVNTANLAGLFCGAVASGFLSDRLGRKPVFTLTLLVYSIFNGLSAAATGVGLLMALRFLAGLGLGGELPVAATLVSELMPARRRGMMVVLLESFWAYGSVAAALIGFLVIPAWGWRAALLIGAIPAFYAFVIRRGVPESPRFLASQGRLEEARRWCARLLRIQAWRWRRARVCISRGSLANARRLGRSSRRSSSAAPWCCGSCGRQ